MNTITTGYNRPGAKPSEGVRESFLMQGMMAGFPETDLTEDLKKMDVPTLVMRGDDQIEELPAFRKA
jgi:non-heme chloroperoxidase